MKAVSTRKEEAANRDLVKCYDHGDLLDELTDEPVDLSLTDELRQSILEGKRRHKLRNVTLKLDPMQLNAIRHE